MLTKLSDLKTTELTDERIQTELISFDSIINGGFEKTGTIVQLISSSGVGKSTIACQICMVLCSKDYNVLYIDSEGSISTNILDSTGLRKYLNSNFFYVRESTFKNVENVLDQYLATDEIDFVVIDSLANLIHDGFDDIKSSKSSSKENEKREKNGAISITTNNSNYNSRQLTLFLSKYSSISKSKKVSMIYINQFRTRITNLFNYAEEKIGGSKNVKYNSDIIVKISEASSSESREFKSFVNKDLDELKGKDLEFEIIKSNQSRTGRKIPFRFIYGIGVSNLYSSFYALYKLGVITRSSSTYTFMFNGEAKKYQGKDNLFENYEDWYPNTIQQVIEYYKNIM